MERTVLVMRWRGGMPHEHGLTFLLLHRDLHSGLVLTAPERLVSNGSWESTIGTTTHARLLDMLGTESRYVSGQNGQLLNVMTAEATEPDSEVALAMVTQIAEYLGPGVEFFTGQPHGEDPSAVVVMRRLDVFVA